MKHSAADFKSIAHTFLHLANSGIPKNDFFLKILEQLNHFSECPHIELWIQEDEKLNYCRIHEDGIYRFELIDSHKKGQPINSGRNSKADIDQIRQSILKKSLKKEPDYLTNQGNYYSNDIDPSLNAAALALIQIYFGEEKIGLLQLMSNHINYFNHENITSYEILAHDLGVAIINQRTQAALRERVKELSCLYKTSRIAEEPTLIFDDIMQQIVEEIKPAWQYPEITEAQIVLDDKKYSTAVFTDQGQNQTSIIRVKGKERGFIEVVYTQEKPDLGDGPFLVEEFNLIDTLAKQIALMVERREAERDRLDLQAQLRHADRLATIGQLSAGVAHELNEPLGNILGFAQLVIKDKDLPQQATEDIDKIIHASLYAREIIKKLMLFARQLPSQDSIVNLNQIVEEGLSFFETRCKKAGIEIIRQLETDLVQINGDQSQLNQVLVNLVVNAIQAMPDGGQLLIKTMNGSSYISLIVEDTGIGMTEETLNKIFIPFFTTKDVNEGTGLGLSVVHGIITSHKGKISVKSETGRGTQFTVQFKT
jgi:signal transduction histidine kinase